MPDLDWTNIQDLNLSLDGRFATVARAADSVKWQLGKSEVRLARCTGHAAECQDNVVVDSRDTRGDLGRVGEQGIALCTAG